MLLDGERAIVDLRKLRDHCLNPDSPRGSGKARVFVSALGLRAADAPTLRKKLLEVRVPEMPILANSICMGNVIR